ncbi:MAG: F0F1 ATP synthase subunit alpha, partial [Bacteroidaceae bacterium]|nr:F0F1 ATP synthase subunit alpha [Bacteroidaceae bacterium]
DRVTVMTLDKGRKNTRLLVQPQYSPMLVENQIAILYCGTHGMLHDVPLDKIQDFEHNFLESLALNHQKDVLDFLKKGILNEEIEKFIKETATKVSKQYLS